MMTVNETAEKAEKADTAVPKDGAKVEEDSKEKGGKPDPKSIGKYPTRPRADVRRQSRSNLYGSLKRPQHHEIQEVNSKG